MLAGDWSALWDAIRHLILPAVVLGWGVTGIVTRLVRASLLDELGSDYVRTARAMGIPERSIIGSQALRNAMLPTITIAGFSFAHHHRCGAVETIFRAGCRFLRSRGGAPTTRRFGGAAWAAWSLPDELRHERRLRRRGPRTGCRDRPRPWRIAVPMRRRFRRPTWLRGPAIIGLTLIVGWALVAITIPLWSPHDPLEPIGPRLMGPGRGHLLGTDALGRDVLTRALWGSRTSLPVAVTVIVAAVLIGSIIGAIAGFFGGWLDTVLMRFSDITMAFRPSTAMAITASLPGPGLRAHRHDPRVVSICRTVARLGAAIRSSHVNLAV